ncbi:hypothetical protein ACIQTW_16815 [Paenarthrobacter sp. NPDC090517]|uniref:hypothetical protein n=1 Tax=Paenarthrobacter sp. NPDC090517 TaxID=3364381 RepID=UPI00382F132C
MKRKEATGMERLIAADPALAVTEEELAGSRGKSLSVVDTYAEQLSVGGSIEDLHRRPNRRSRRVMIGAGALAAAAVVVGVVLTSSMQAPFTEQAAPIAMQPDLAPHNDSTSSPNGLPPLLLGSPTPTVEADIVTGNAGKLAVSTTEIDHRIAEGIHMRPDVLRILKLEADKSGCIGNGFLFPTGTKVTDSGLVMPDGTSFSIGDVISFGGFDVDSRDVGKCADGRQLVYMEDVRAYPLGVPGGGG